MMEETAPVPAPPAVKPQPVKPSIFQIKKPEPVKTIEVKEERQEPQQDQFAPVPMSTAPIGNGN